MNTQQLAFQNGTATGYLESSSAYHSWHPITDDSSSVQGNFWTLEYDTELAMAMLRELLSEYLSLGAIQSYKDRIEELRVDAAEEGISINETSIDGFGNFIHSIPGIVRGGLFLTEQGNLRAAWNDDSEDHVGLEFLDEQRVLYVIFRDSGDGNFDDEADYSDIGGVISKIQGYNLMHLLTDV